MKKVIKNKLFFERGCLRNLLVLEIAYDGRIAYEIIEEVKGRHVSTEVLHGWYNRKVKALSEFKKLVRSVVVHYTPGYMAFS